MTDGTTAIRIFVQARMSSRRFPGKVLATLAGRPMIDHVLGRCGQAFGLEQVVLATSAESSDDALADHAATLGVRVFRGELDNVVGRFQRCLADHPCEWFVRISADSPLIDPCLVARVAERRAPHLDLVTNVQPRTFPAGQSVEVVNSGSFAALDAAALTADEREHATLVFYRHPERFRVLNVASRDPRLASQHLAVDTLEELRRVEAMLASGQVPAFAEAIAP
jgi:spore coat polysaccharide biosynthesis protein SpsF (cytidylyltransferase family)